MRSREYGKLSLLLLLAITLGSCAHAAPPLPHAKGTIAIGVNLPLSGTDSSEGTPVLAGIRFALARQGRLRGYDLSLSVYDDAVRGEHAPQAAADNLRGLVADSRVLGVIGPFHAAAALAEIPIASAAGLALVSPSTSNECLTKNLPYCGGLAAKLRGGHPLSFFRMAATDDLQGPAMAGYAVASLHLHNLAVVSDKTLYGLALADAFQAKFAALGGAVVQRVDYDPTSQKDFSALLESARKLHAEGVYFGGVAAKGGCILRSQMAAHLGPDVPELGAEGFALDDQCVRQAGTGAAGMFGTSARVNASALASAQPTVTAFRSAYPSPDDYSSFTIPAYEATRVLIDAIGRSIDAAGGGIPTREAVRAQMAATSGFASAMGPVGLDGNGDSTLRFVSIYTTRGTPVAWQFVTQIQM